MRSGADSDRSEEEGSWPRELTGRPSLPTARPRCSSSAAAAGRTENKRAVSHLGDGDKGCVVESVEVASAVGRGGRAGRVREVVRVNPGTAREAAWLRAWRPYGCPCYSDRLQGPVGNRDSLGRGLQINGGLGHRPTQSTLRMIAMTVALLIKAENVKILLLT